jgi:hypothetical protein
MDPQIQIRIHTKMILIRSTALSVSRRWLQYNVIYCRDPLATTVGTAIKEVRTPAQLSKPGVVLEAGRPGTPVFWRWGGIASGMDNEY